MKKASSKTRSKSLKKNRSAKKKHHVVKLRGKIYKIYKTGKIGNNLWAYCTHPDFANRIIKIHKDLDNDTELDTLIHEMLHACFWDLDEEVISQVGTDISKALWKIGYRKQK